MSSHNESKRYLKSKLDVSSRQSGVNMDLQEEISSLPSLYKGLFGVKLSLKAYLMLETRSWFNNIHDFDPLSGETLDTNVDELLLKVMENTLYDGFELNDRLTNLLFHVKDAIKYIKGNLRDIIVREHLMTPLYAAKQFDSTCIQWISRQSGRTVKEKLAGKTHIKAVQKTHNVNTLENTLFKAFLLRLEEEMLIKKNTFSKNLDINISYFGKEEIDVLEDIQKWLISDDANHISRLTNFAPNNILLQDKYYRKIWNAWLSLKTLEENIKIDSDRLLQDILTVIFWKSISLLSENTEFRVIQQSIHSNYDEFLLNPYIGIKAVLLQNTNSKNLEFQLNHHTITIYQSINKQENIIKIRIDKNTLYFENNSKKILFPFSKNVLNDTAKAIFSVLTNINASSVTQILATKKSNSQQILSSDVMISLDLTLTRPRFSYGKKTEFLPFRLLAQYFKNANTLLDCTRSKAILLSSEVTSISNKNLLSQQKENISLQQRENTALFFMHTIKDFFKTNTINYIIPDWSNDFELEPIRKAANLYFKEANPIPKSIATAFYWQANKSDITSSALKNTLLIVVDIFEYGISFTPVEATFNDSLERNLPESRGIIWERHPSFIFDAVNKQEQELGQDENILELFDLKSLQYEYDNFSFMKNDVFHNITCKNIISTYSQESLEKYINVCLKDFLPLHRNIIFFSNNETIKIPENKVYRNEHLIIDEARGCTILSEWQSKVRDISLWKDHLPELSTVIPINGIYQNFYFVKKTSITPKRGVPVPIDIESIFTLPANQNTYHFALEQGKTKLQFEAYLQSSAFPLKEDTECRLCMTYTYGADIPYTLKFIPEKNIPGLEELIAEWKSINEEAIDLNSLPTPNFPEKKTWEILQAYPDRDGTCSNLVDWCKESLANLEVLVAIKSGEPLSSDLLEDSYFGKKIHREEGRILWGKEDRNNDYFYFVESNSVKYFCHSKTFAEKSLHPLEKNTTIYFSVDSKSDKPRGLDITVSEKFPTDFIKKIYKELARNLFEMRFPLRTIFNNRALSDADFSDTLRYSILNATKNAMFILKIEATESDYAELKELKEEIMLVFFCLHKDMPSNCTQYLIRLLREYLTSTEYNKQSSLFFKNSSFALGSADLEWQKELLEILISPQKNSTQNQGIQFEILGTALWRSENLILLIRNNNLKYLIEGLYEEIESKLNGLTSLFDKSAFNTSKERRDNAAQRIIRTLCRYLELLLALLRARRLPDQEIKELLSPGNSVMKKYVAIIDRISSYFKENNITLKSFVDLSIDKPESLQNTPDLIYALRLYITGDSGANSIIIKGFEEK